MKYKRILAVTASTVLLCLFTFTASAENEITRVREIAPSLIRSERTYSKMVTLGCDTSTIGASLTIQPDATSDGVRQTLSIMSMIESSCRAFYLESGRMPDNLTELRSSGLLIFDPVAQEYSPGLKLTDENTDIRLTQLTPQDNTGGPEMRFAVDWTSSSIPGLATRSSGSTATPRTRIVESPMFRNSIVEKNTGELKLDVENWANLYVDINSNGICLAGYEVEANGLDNPLTWLLMDPQPEPPGRQVSPPEFEFTKSWVYINPQPAPLGGQGPGPTMLNYQNSEYDLWKGEPFGYKYSDEEADKSIKITPWVLMSAFETEPLDKPSDSKAVIRGRLTMDACGIIIDNYVAKYGIIDDNQRQDGNTQIGISSNGINSDGFAPPTASTLLDGLWSINSNSFLNESTIEPGTPGSSKMIIIIYRTLTSGEERGIIVQRKPTEQETAASNDEGQPGEEQGIIIIFRQPTAGERGIIDDNRPEDENALYNFVFELVNDRGETEYYVWVSDVETGESCWLPFDLGDAAIIDDNNRELINSIEPLLDSGLPGWGFNPAISIPPSI